MTRYLLAWFVLLLIAVLNGALRQTTFGRTLPELRAHQLSTLIGAVLIGAAIWFIVRAWPPASARDALAVGGLWLILTVAFECFMGIVLLHRSWPQVLADYDLAAGRVWLLFLIWLALAPSLFRWLQTRGAA